MLSFTGEASFWLLFEADDGLLLGIALRRLIALGSAWSRSGRDTTSSIDDKPLRRLSVQRMVSAEGIIAMIYCRVRWSKRSIGAVDDIIFGCSSHALVVEFAETMRREFEMSMMGE